MKRTRLTAAAVTAIFAVLLIVLLGVCKLTINIEPWPPVSANHTELVEVEEEFVEFFEPAKVRANPSPAYSDEIRHNNSEGAIADGNDLADAGQAAAPAPVKTSERTSEVKKQKKDTPTQTGPDRTAAEQERARRKARSGIANAFKENTQANDNTTAKGKEPGDSGNPSGQPSDVNGTGSGTVGGGWIMPSYAKVEARQTGSIELRAIVDSQGRVISCDLTGGKAPAAADPALVAKCIAEVRRHRFTRTDNDAPERSTARIIYRFK